MLNHIPVNKPFFIKQNGCPTKRKTNFFAILLENSFDNDLFKTISKQILDKATPLCKENVSASYVEESLEDCHLLLAIYYYDVKQLGLPITSQTILDYPNSIPYTFATCIDRNRLTKKKSENSLYIDVICSNLLGPLSTFIPKPPQGGKTALNILTIYGKQNNYRYLTLSALVSVINYYRRLGFRHIKYGQTSELADIKRLAELNSKIIFGDIDDAKQQIKVERAYKLSMEIGNKNKADPVFVENEFAKLLEQTLNLDEPPNEDEITAYVAELDDRITDNNGSDGFYDLVGLLIRHGFGSDKCNGITQRNLIQFDEDSNIFLIACVGDGFIMRKPLSDLDDPVLSSNIIQCQTTSKTSSSSNNSGKSHTRKRKRTHGTSRSNSHNSSSNNSGKSHTKRIRRRSNS